MTSRARLGLDSHVDTDSLLSEIISCEKMNLDVEYVRGEAKGVGGNVNMCMFGGFHKPAHISLHRVVGHLVGYLLVKHK